MGDIYDDVFGSPREVPHQETFVGVINSEFKERGICERCGQQWPCEVARLTTKRRRKRGKS